MAAAGVASKLATRLSRGGRYGMDRIRRSLFTKIAGAMAILTAGAILGRPTAALADHSFRINNRGGHTISAVFISGVDRENWGQNLLGDYYIGPEHYQTFTIREGCAEDVMLVYTDGHRSTRRNLDTCRYNLDSNY
jgi:hypothetical protein